MSKVARYFVGIDLHVEVIQVCVLDREGEVVEEKRFRVLDGEDRKGVVSYLRAWEGGRFTVEALSLNRWLVNGCRRWGLWIVVANPLKLGLKAQGKKTDRRDAYELARRLRLGDIERNAVTYFPTEGEYWTRQVIRRRHGLVRQRQQIVNQIKSMLRAYGDPVPARPLYSARGIQRLREGRYGRKEEKALVVTLAGVLESIQRAIETLTAQIRGYAKDARVKRLMVLPQVAEQTAATLVNELGDVSRFHSARAVSAYAGLVPRVSQSADTAHHGRVTKQGNKELRWILGQWAVRLMTKDPQVRRWAEPRLRRMAKNKVRTALARRLVVGVYVMLQRDEAFSMEACLGS